MMLQAPLTRDNQTFAELYEGWQEVARTELAPDLVAIVLQAAHCPTICWYANADHHLLATHAGLLEASSRARLLQAIEPWARPLMEHSVARAPEGRVSQDAPTLPAPLLTEIASVWAVEALPYLVVRPATWAQSVDQASEATVSGPRGLAIQERRLAALMAARITGDALVVPSPFNGLPLRAQLTMDCADLAVYRFYDTEHDTAFYLAWSILDADARPVFFCPRSNLIVSDQPEPALLPGRILAWYARHPDHAHAIAGATPFQATDFGLGSASALAELPPYEEEAADQTPGISDSAAWSLLRDVPTGPSQPAPTPKPRGLFARLFGA